MSTYDAWLPAEGALPTEQPKTETPFFAVSIVKLVVMTILTFGLYETYWEYKQWKRIQKQGAPSISPFWRTFFGLFFIHELFKLIRMRTEEEALPKTLPLGVLTGIYVGAVLISRFDRTDGWLGFAGLFLTIPVAMAQHEINQLHAKLAPDADRNGRFTAWNIIIGEIGLIAWALIVIGELLPDPG